MKKHAILSLLILLSAPVQAFDFFGIEHNGNTADNVINLLYSLIQNDQQQADIFYGQLQKTDPSLAKELVIENLQIPCSTCMGTSAPDSENPCPQCNGTGRKTDSLALTYLQKKFCSALDSGRSEKSAWKTAKAAFDQRSERVLSRQTVSGTILRREKRGLLLSCHRSDEIIYVTNMAMMFSRKGAPTTGRVWPNGTYTYTDDDGNPVEVPSYTAALWVD